MPAPVMPCCIAARQSCKYRATPQQANEDIMKYIKYGVPRTGYRSMDL